MAIGCTTVESSFLFSFLFLFPTTTFSSPRQGTWLTRPGPRPQIESTLTGFLIDRWSYIALAYCPCVQQLCASYIKPFSRWGRLFLSLTDSLVYRSILIVTVETGVPRGKPQQRLLGYLANSIPAVLEFPLSPVQLCTTCNKFEKKKDRRSREKKNCAFHS